MADMRNVRQVIGQREVMEAINDAKLKAEPETADVLMELARRSGFSPEEKGAVFSESDMEDLLAHAQLIRDLALAMDCTARALAAELRDDQTTAGNSRRQATTHVKGAAKLAGVDWKMLAPTEVLKDMEEMRLLITDVKALAELRPPLGQTKSGELWASIDDHLKELDHG